MRSTVAPIVHEPGDAHIDFGNLAPTPRVVLSVRTAMSPTYRSMLKPLEVEELIDLAVHRPLAWGITRAVYATPVTPDQLTVVSMLIGVAAGACVWSSFLTGAAHLRLAGFLFILSAVFDCSDGQLARARQTSSTFGRMLDGMVDTVVQLAVVPGAIAHVWWRHGGASPGVPPLDVRAGSLSAYGWLALGAFAVWSGAQHTAVYDHFKNVYLHHILPHRKEGDDVEDLDAHDPRVLGALLRWIKTYAYRPYILRQRRLLAWIDPLVPARFRDMAPYTEAGAARFRGLYRSVMRAWSFYGIGTHIFGLGVALAFDQVEVYIVARALVFNLGLFALIPAQRRASREFFRPSASHPAPPAEVASTP